MTLQNRTVRAGVDLAIAAKAAALLPQYENVVPPASGWTAEHPAPVAPVPREGLGRKIVGRMYRWLKPRLRPVVWRVRNYLNHPVADHLMRLEATLTQRLDRVSQPAAVPPVVTQQIAALHERTTGIQRAVADQSVLIARLPDVLARSSPLPVLEKLTGLMETELARAQARLEHLETDASRAHADSDRIEAQLAQTQARLERVENELLRSRDQLELAHTQLGRSHEQLALLQDSSGRLVDAVGQIHAELAPISALDAQLGRIEDYSLASARRVAIACGPGKVLVRTEAGYMLCADTDAAVLATLVETGDLERGTRLLIQRLLQPGETFVDVGANLGIHTLAAARTLQGQGKVIAFEPYPETERLLTANVWLNGFSSIVEVHQAAVSNRAGRQPLHLGATSGHNSLFPLGPMPTVLPRSVEVPVVRLDETLGPDSRIDLLKIDVEGAELDVLESAAALIERNPSVAVIAEYGGSHLERTGHGVHEWLAAFRKLGLEYRTIEPDTGELRKCSEERLQQYESINLLFARPGSVAWARAGGAG